MVNYNTPFVNWTNILCNVSFEDALIIIPSPVSTSATIPLQNTERTYYISPNRLSWWDAEDYCVNHCGSHLASVHSADQWLAVGIAVESDIYNETYKRDVSQYGWSNAVWTGLKRNENDTGYIYSDGSLLDYGVGAISNNSNGDCVQLDIDDGYTAKGVNCNSLGRVLCNSCDGKLNKYIMVKVNELTWGNAERFCFNHFKLGKLASFHNERDFDEMRVLCDDANTRENKLCHICLGTPAGNNQFRWSDETDF